MAVVIYCYIGCEDEVTTWYYSTQLKEVVNTYDLGVVFRIQRIGCQTDFFISHKLIRYESSRGHKIDGTKPNQTGNTFGNKQGKQAEENGQVSSQRRTSSR